MKNIYNIQYYNYTLPEDLVARFPAEKRSGSRIMVLDRNTGGISHRFFHELPSLIPEHTYTVINNTKVFPARLRVVRSGGGKSEIFLLQRENGSLWRALARPAGKIRAGNIFTCGDSLTVTIEKDLPAGEKIVRLATALSSIETALEQAGEIPLPPYIGRRHPDSIDRERYQTVYAREWGSSAAPTAGLHFTRDILSEMKDRNIGIMEVTLHVGSATFLPVRTEDIRQHRMHTEPYSIPAEVFHAVRTHSENILAVGTTSLRTLETAVRTDSSPENGVLHGETDLFVYPGFEFRAVDMLLTNFHLPRSTLLMLVCAFAGRDTVMNAYHEAIDEKYRFYSYGDCMLIK